LLPRSNLQASYDVKKSANHGGLFFVDDACLASVLSMGKRRRRGANRAEICSIARNVRRDVSRVLMFSEGPQEAQMPTSTLVVLACFMAAPLCFMAAMIWADHQASSYARARKIKG
jgi:hypothetical protein